MRRRSRAGGDPARRRETASRKRCNRPKAVRRRRSSGAGRETKEACQAIGPNPRSDIHDDFVVEPL